MCWRTVRALFSKVKSITKPTKAQNAIELVDYGRESFDANYAHVIQSFNRFLIDHLSLEGNAFPHNPVLVHTSPPELEALNPAPAPVTQLLGIDAKNIITCMNCQATREKDNMTHVVDLIYPRKVCIVNDLCPFCLTFIYHFIELLQRTNTRGGLRQYSP